MNSEIMVSVICNAYNHEKYIKDALDGFVMQNTNFGFEILVHDDASTDGTADIIRQYEARYPDLIKPIYQTENQYSKKKGLVTKIQFGRAKGKYVAFCEGDDYWTDPLKLQKQFDAMQAHPDIDMCAHTADAVSAATGQKISTVKPGNEDCIFDLGAVIMGGGGFVATSSLFFKKELCDNIPEFRRFLMLDYTLQIQGSLKGGMLYLKDNMSVYRRGVSNSWTHRMGADKQLLKKHTEKVIEMLSILDRELDFKYTDVIQKRSLHLKFSILYRQGDIDSILKAPYIDIFKKLPLKQKIKLLLAGVIKKCTIQEAKK